MKREGGYVLISALWLLLLAGVLTALILTQTRQQAENLRDSSDALRLRHILASAIATVNADRIFSGPTSNWWNLPAQGTAMVSGIEVSLSLSNEAERLDLNRASRAAILEAAFLHPMTTDERQALLIAIETRRASDTPFYSAREVEALVAEEPNRLIAAAPSAGVANKPTSPSQSRLRKSDYFTVASSLEVPRTVPIGDGSTPPTQGDAVRVIACAQIGNQEGCAIEIGRFALRPVTGWQRIDGWIKSN